MPILSRYLSRFLLATSLVCVVTLVSIVVLADLFSSLDDFLGHKASVGTIALYYLAYLPSTLVMATPFALFFAALYVVLQLQRRNELLAMQACGVSPWFIYLPFLTLGLAAVAAILGIEAAFLGRAQAKRERILAQMRGSLPHARIVHGFVYPEPDGGRLWYFQRLDVRHGRAEGVEVLERGADGAEKRKFIAREATWQGHWTFQGVQVLEFGADGEFLETHILPSVSFESWVVSPVDMMALEKKPKEMGLLELTRLLDKAKRAWGEGASLLAPYWVQWYSYWLGPFSTLVLLSFALVECDCRRKEGFVSGALQALALFGAFEFLASLFSLLGKAGRIPPAFSVAFPLVFFGLLGAYLCVQSSFSQFGLPGFQVFCQWARAARGGLHHASFLLRSLLPYAHRKPPPSG
jgi:lipopolysaccharide export system permease protein